MGKAAILLKDVAAFLRVRKNAEPSSQEPLQRTLLLSSLEDRLLFSATPVSPDMVEGEEGEGARTQQAEMPPTDVETSGTTDIDQWGLAPVATTEQVSDSPFVGTENDLQHLTDSAVSSGDEFVYQWDSQDQSLAVATVESEQAVRHELVFVDTGAKDYRLLLDDLLASEDESRSFDVVLLDSSRDGIEQISEALAGYEDLDAVHIVSHGTDRAVKLGSTWLQLSNVDAYAGEISLWGNAFSADADLLFYGCNLAGGEDGRTLLEGLSELTGTDVAASVDDTGSDELGGDWELEYELGEIETAVTFSVDAQQSWSGLLNTFVVTTTADGGAGSLRQAIIDANATAGTDTISFSISGSGPHTISLDSALPVITEIVILDGWSEPDFAGDPVIRLDGASAGAGVDGLTFASTSDGSVVQGLMITRFTRHGIQINAGADGITLRGNWIGTAGTGTTGFGNVNTGIYVQGANTIVGGTGVNDGNVITNNSNEGINVTGTGATGTIIQGNIIGLDPDGSTGSGNADVGIALLAGAHNTVIGGTTAAARNVISNNFEGLEINSNNNVVQGNYIGTDISGALDRGNRSDDGVEIQNSATGNLIGGTSAGAGNLIAFNARDGVYVASGNDNTVLGNTIHSNANLGIDLGTNGVSLNDSGDGDGGANNRQNFPVISSAELSGTDLTLNGSLDTDGLNTQYRIEFFGNPAGTQDASHGEARAYLGFVTVTTDGAGDATFSNVTLSGVTLSLGDYVTATATVIDDAGQVGVDDQLAYGSTSEFAANVAVNTAPSAVDDPADFNALLTSLSPVSYWRLGENSGTTASDESGTADGTYHGATLAQGGGVAGDADTAVYFDGVDDYVEIPHDPSYLVDEGTIQLWFNADAPANGDLQHLFSKDSSGYDTGGHLSIYLDATGRLEVRLQSASSDYVVNSAAAVSGGTWHHVALSFGTNGMELYLDGALIDTNAYTGGLGTSSGGTGNYEPIAIGAGTQTSGNLTIAPVDQFFAGSIDEVAIIGSQLDATTIQQLYIAATQSYTVSEDTPLNVTATNGVLANDSDSDGDSLTASLVSGPSNAKSFTLNPNGSFDYTPNDDFSGTDTFTYRAYDGTDYSNVATVTITVNPVNDDPYNAGTLQSASVVTEDVSSVINLSAIDLADVDAGSLTLTLTTSTGGNLTAAAAAGVTIGGNGSGNLSLTGSLTDLNNYLNNASNVTYLHGVPNTSGFAADTITVQVTDNGSTGSGGGGLVSLGTFNVDITAVNDAPTIVSWYNNAWDYRKEITIDSSQVETDATDFAVLISITADADLAAYAQADGDDILFTAADGTTKLAHEVESYNSATGELRVWVKTDLSAAVDTNLFLYYGNGSASAQEDPNNVWTADYVGVWHLEDAPTGAPGDVQDSTSYGNHGITQGAMDGADSVAAMIGNGLDFDEVDDHIRISDSASLDSVNDEATMSLWIWFDDTSDGNHQIIMSSSNRYSGIDGYEWASQGDGDHFFYPDAGLPDTNYNLGADPFIDQQWHHLAVTMDFATKNVEIYVDGNAMTFSTEGVPGSWTSLTSSDDWLWGGNPDRSARFFDGMMDELRVAGTARSQEWIQTEVNNQSNPSTFYSVGGVENRDLLLTAVMEDDTNPTGDTIQDILLNAGGDRITDADAGAVEGIAVTGVDNTNGQWQYDANADGTWIAFGSVSDTSAALLDSDAKLRFVPDPDYSGPGGNLTFRAWDRTSGANGDTGVNVSANGGTTSYSTNTCTVSLIVTPENDAPTVSLTNVVPSLAEDADTSSAIRIADIVITDDALGTNNLSLTGVDSADFEIVGTELRLRAGTTLNFESKSSFDVTVQVDDTAIGGTPDDTAAHTLSITDVNEVPTVSLTNVVASLTEDTDTSSAIKIADIVITDDALGVNGLSLSGADASDFEIVGTELRLRAGTILDAATKSNYDVIVEVDDSAIGATPDDTAAHTLTITDVNQAPTVSLTNVVATLTEDTDTSAAIKIADIVITDDALGTNSLSLTGADAADFEIVGTELRLRAGTTLNFEAKSSFDVTVQVDDTTVGGTPDDTAAHTLSITDVNEVPTVSLTNLVSNLTEDTDTSSAIRVADIVVTDDALGTNNLTLTGADAADFEIVGTELRLRAGTTLDFESKTSFDVTVQVDDTAIGATPDDTTAHTLTITDVNEPPNVSLTNVTAALLESTDTSSPVHVADIVINDDALGSNSLSLTGADAAMFEINAGSLFLRAGTTLDAISNPLLDVTIEIDDPALGGGVDDSASIAIIVSDVNNPPTVSLTNVVTSLAEDTDTSAAIRIADIGVSDDALGTNTLSLSGSDASSFEIVGTELRLRAGTALDHETKSTFNVTVNVDDATVGATPDDGAVHSLDVADVNEAPIADEEVDINEVSEADLALLVEDESDDVQEASAESSFGASSVVEDQGQPSAATARLATNQPAASHPPGGPIQSTAALPRDRVRIDFADPTFVTASTSTVDLPELATGTSRSLWFGIRNRGVDMDSTLSSLVNTFSTFDVGQLWNGFETLTEDLQADEGMRSIVITGVVGVTSIATTGYAVWALRSGYFVMTALASIPSWKSFDLIPILEFDERSRPEQRGKKYGKGSWTEELEDETQHPEIV